MRWIGLLLPLFLGLTGCNAESMCHSIELGTPVSSLPVWQERGVWFNGATLKGSREEYRARYCCELYCNFENCSKCPDVDCKDPRLQGDFLELKAPYSGDCMEGSIEAHYTCTVWEHDGKVMSVMGYCS